MRKGGGGPKGAQFERECCVAFSKAITKGKRNDLFWRTAMSGGRATVMNRHARFGINKSQAGDITCIDAEGLWLTERFVIECKFNKDFNLQHFLINGGGDLKGFWQKVTNQARRLDRKPMLIAKQNRFETLVFTGTCHILPPEVDPACDPLLIMSHKGIYVFKFDEVLAHIQRMSK